MKVIVQNLATEYRDEGGGPVVLLLHGWRDDLHTFDALASLLAADHRVVRVDLPGFGQSEMPKTPWHLDDYVRFVHDFTHKLGITVDILIGHSFGGRIVIKGTAANMLDAQKIVLIASAGVAERSTFGNLFFRVLAKIGRLVTSIPPFALLREPLQRRLYRRAGGDYLSAGPLKETFLNIIGEDLTASARAIEKPALLVWGSEDAETPVRDGQRLATLIPGAALEVIPGAGHFVHRKKSRDVSELIRNFSRS
ncbi:MAG: alpha/beta hydrolase [Candidatus Sungbacteria bacterium]|nr:alpha/beta hydrolase [Candidatus Sungbacteria bacterium]